LVHGAGASVYEFYIAELLAFHNMCVGRNRLALDALIEVGLGRMSSDAL